MIKVIPLNDIVHHIPFLSFQNHTFNQYFIRLAIIALLQIKI